MAFSMSASDWKHPQVMLHVKLSMLCWPAIVSTHRPIGRMDTGQIWIQENGYRHSLELISEMESLLLTRYFLAPRRAGSMRFRRRETQYRKRVPGDAPESDGEKYSVVKEYLTTRQNRTARNTVSYINKVVPDDAPESGGEKHSVVHK
ncbi:hypothetical protein ElyMa_004399000 [Elysia marginata]|uniref:Uncharacterized protein n=1 Tax=Elysia marginata TaxID=1093978 RepID=A0AAV4H8L2_9GAST|nr:hypothetical protein ElyMa_004399000 [Elysia marginata]